MAITGSRPGTFRTLAEQRLGRLRSELDYGNIEEIIGGGIHEFIDGFQTRLNLVGEAIYEAFFALPPAHDFAPSSPQSQTQTQDQSQRLAPLTETEIRNAEIRDANRRMGQDPKRVSDI